MLSGDIVWQKLPQENFISCFIPRCLYGCSALFTRYEEKLVCVWCPVIGTW